MFVENLKQIDIEKEFLPELCQTTSFDIITVGDRKTIFFMYKNLMDSKDISIFLSDFGCTGLDDTKYLKFMYKVFGEKYKKAYLNYLGNKLFN
jgi:hypothetical protein